MGILGLFGAEKTPDPDSVKEKTGKTLEEWKLELTDEEFRVLFLNKTQRPFTGDLLNENRSGTFVTRACRLPVFTSQTKFKSGTGWVSFYDVIEENVELIEDRSFGMRRIEVRSKCGEHLGHVFPDGPAPTYQRYCINDAALDFIPDEDNGK